ncbi:hypothetical protein [Nocardia sp. NPDC005745]|uniref:hypothetical protein n=1 Tax=Nocardia sp. NPDC005745 TaxID=3157061 RepID=UPI0033D2C160
MDLNGIGPSDAARLLADADDIHRFESRERFTPRNGRAPWTLRPGLGGLHVDAGAAGHVSVRKIFALPVRRRFHSEIDRGAF